MNLNFRLYEKRGRKGGEREREREREREKATTHL